MACCPKCGARKLKKARDGVVRCRRDGPVAAPLKSEMEAHAAH